VPDAAASPRFLAEARALAALEHPHIVKVRDVGHEQGVQWFAMDLLSGGTLGDRVRAEGALPPVEALRCVYEALVGLAALHHAGIVHRDIKPDNLFVAGGGRVVLGDLGVAQMPGGEVSYQTATGTNLGTVDYAAPEQEIDASRVQPEADLYGMGATLYYLVTARRPAFLFAPDDVPEQVELIPESLKPLILKACEYAPRDRFRSARQMAVAVCRTRDALQPDVAPVIGDWLRRFDALSPPPPLLRRLCRLLGV
jgi:serine/threonine-protein kinase